MHGSTGGELPVLRMYSPLYGLYAWVVRQTAAEELLKHAFPVEGQVDHALSKWLVQRGRSFKVAPHHLLSLGAVEQPVGAQVLLAEE